MFEEPPAMFEEPPRTRPKRAGRPGAGSPSWQPSQVRRTPYRESFDGSFIAGGRARSQWRLRWTVPLVALALAASVCVIGFVNPGLFMVRVFDDEALRDGVRLVLERDFHLAQVTELQCPRRQPVEPHSVFLCAVRINGAPSTVPVIVQDKAGRYAVGRPS
jgi:hypothetical protein